MVEIQGGQYPDEVGECFDNIIRDDFNPDSILDDIDLLYDEASINGYRKGMEHGAIIAAALSIAGFVAGWFGTTFGIKIREIINRKKQED